MAVPVIMPRQGQSVETCIIGSWNKHKGDAVKKGDVLFSYETDKASFEEEAKEDGMLLDIFFNEGDEVPVLVNVAVIGNPGEDVEAFRPGGVAVASPASVEEQKSEPVVEKVLETSAATVSQSQREDGRVFASPRAKGSAEKNGIDVAKLAGSGPEGRVIERDVEMAAQTMPRMTSLAKEMIKQEELVSKGEGTGLGGRVSSADLVTPNQVYAQDFELQKLSNIRKLIAKAMHASLQNSAQLTHHMGADARKVLELRKKFKKDFEAGKVSQNVTINDFVCMAVIRALKKFPQVNSHFLGDQMRIFNKVHLGLAVDTERGLMVPVVRNADDLSIEGLASQLKAVAEQSRKGSINPELLNPEAASFTVSNLGNYGVEVFTPVINLPQSAILGVCTVVPRPADLGGGVYGFVPYMGLSLTYDHRALDGGEATLFLKEIKLQIENFEL
ncbi:MAG: dihydrolipoamide acetyltransferase family protein [Bacteroidota bacterium]|nr:dihydrolipoamide acetyltransferase family protein [Bacteroidota bacterium]MDP4204649.1 dihydrolipoamide acetyltransferase family protein [Bacteroidota bacterium]